MKRFLPLLTAALIAAMCALSCTQEIEGTGLDSREKARPEMTNQHLVLTASIEDNDPDTKTQLDADGKFLWSPGDAINLIFGSGDGSQFTATNEEPVATTQFEGYLSAVTGFDEDAPDLKFWGIFPYNPTHSVFICSRSDHNNLPALEAGQPYANVVLPATQTTGENTWGKEQFPYVGQSLGLAMGFRNLMSGFKFYLTTDGITEIQIKGNNNENLGGSVIVSMGNGVPEIVAFNPAAPAVHKEITLNPPRSVTGGPGTFKKSEGDNKIWYYLAVPPTTFSSGVTFTFVTNDSTGVRKFSSSMTLARNNFTFWPNAPLDRSDKTTWTENPLPNNQITYTATAQVNYYIPDNSTTGNVVTSNTWDSTTGKGVITFSEAITYLDNYAFSDMNDLLSVKLPEGLKKIGENAFEGCNNLVNVSIPSTVNSIGSLAFLDCRSLKSIAIPRLAGIGYHNPFAACTSLESFSGPQASADGKFFGFHLDDPTEGYLACCALGAFKNKECVLPEVATISAEACLAGEFTSVVIPETVTTIEEKAFSDCSNLTGTLTIPGSVIEIGEKAFFCCTNLSTIVLAHKDYNVSFNTNPVPEMPTIGEYAFHTRGTTGTPCTIKIPGGLAVGSNPKIYHEEDVWYGYKDQVIVYQADNEIWLYSGSVNTGTSGVLGSDGESLSRKIVGSIIPFGFDATYYSQPNVTVEPTVPFPSNFTIKPIDVQIYSGDITALGNTAFNPEGADRPLMYVSLPHSVEYIGQGAFKDEIELLAFPSDGYNLRTIGDRAFQGCTAMTGKVEFWHHESSGGGIPVSTCGDYSFAECVNINEVTLHECGTVGSYAFTGCTGLQKVNLENAVALDIYPYAFSGCSLLSRIAPSSSSEDGLFGSFGIIGERALDGTKLTKLKGGVRIFMRYSLRGSGIKDIYLKGSANVPTAIDQRAFLGCSDLVSVYIPNVDGELGESAFNGCNKLSSLYLGATAIPDSYFYNLTSLQEVILPKVVSIGEKAFGQTRNLEYLRLGENLTSIGNDVFYDTDKQLRNNQKLSIYFYGNPIGSGNFSEANWGIEWVNAFCFDSSASTKEYMQFKLVGIKQHYYDLDQDENYGDFERMVYHTFGYNYLTIIPDSDNL